MLLSAPVCCSCDSFVAGRRGFELPCLRQQMQGPERPAAAKKRPELRCCRRRLRRGRARLCACFRRGEAARRRAVADRARRQRRGQIAERHGGPPYFWFAEVASPAAGTWQATAHARPPAECSTITREIAVAAPRAAAAGGERREASGRCAIPGTARRKTCIPRGSKSCSTRRSTRSLSWPALHEVLRDRSRNMLFNYLGVGEDDVAMLLRPDCAELPYFLRAYFSFKMGLPFGYSKCSRGGGGKPPKCYRGSAFRMPVKRALRAGSRSNDRVRPVRHVPPAALPAGERSAGQGGWGSAGFLRPLSARRRRCRPFRRRRGRAANDDNTDFYPVPLKQETLRPGTVYADPYGHVLMLVQARAADGGAAASSSPWTAQPDGTVARKRFWRGNFLFAQNPALGSPGFKRFRPIVARNGSLAAADQRRNREKSAIRRLFARTVAARRRRVLRPHGRRDVARAARSRERDEGGDRLARRASEDARDLGRERPQVPEQRHAATRTCRTARRSSRPTAPGKISPRRRAIFAC